MVQHDETAVNMEDDPLLFQKAIESAEPISKWNKLLYPYERELLEQQELYNITHYNSSSVWLAAPSSIPPSTHTNVYRPMGDIEAKYLVEKKLLPDTQPYQAIIEGEEGRNYATKYLNGTKWTDTHPTTVVEFTAPKELIEELKKRQIKVEDGALSMGLGHKAGKGLPFFNDSLRKRETTFRIVKVKRNKKM